MIEIEIYNQLIKSQEKIMDREERNMNNMISECKMDLKSMISNIPKTEEEIVSELRTLCIERMFALNESRGKFSEQSTRIEKRIPNDIIGRTSTVMSVDYEAI